MNLLDKLKAMFSGNKKDSPVSKPITDTNSEISMPDPVATETVSSDSSKS